jgi:hypothetical protein
MAPCAWRSAEPKRRWRGGLEEAGRCTAAGLGSRQTPHASRPRPRTSSPRLYDVWPSPRGPAAKAAAPHDDASSNGASGVGEEGGPGGSGTGGTVYVNGVDVRQLRLSDLRSAIAVVPQVDSERTGLLVIV